MSVLSVPNSNFEQILSPSDFWDTLSACFLLLNLLTLHMLSEIWASRGGPAPSSLVLPLHPQTAFSVPSSGLLSPGEVLAFLLDASPWNHHTPSPPRFHTGLPRLPKSPGPVSEVLISRSVPRQNTSTSSHGSRPLSVSCHLLLPCPHLQPLGSVSPLLVQPPHGNQGGLPPNQQIQPVPRTPHGSPVPLRTKS